MKRLNLSVAFLLAAVVLSKAEVEPLNTTYIEEEEEEIRCNNIGEALWRHQKCLNSYNVTGYTIDIGSLIMHGSVTRDKLLADVNSTCSNRNIDEAYRECTRDIISVCPDFTDDIVDIFEEKISFICESDQPSSWIHDVLSEDYLLTFECFYGPRNEIEDIMSTCIDEAIARLFEKFKDREGSDTIAAARLRYKTYIADAFKCTTQPYYGDATLPCGSKKRDVLLTHWILFSTSGETLRPPIAQEAKDYLTLTTQFLRNLIQHVLIKTATQRTSSVRSESPKQHPKHDTWTYMKNYEYINIDMFQQRDQLVALFVQNEEGP